MGRRRLVRRTLIGATLLVAGTLAVLVVEAVIARRTVPDDGYVAPSPEPRSFGRDGDPPLSYVVLGDSTGAGRGAPYERSVAVRTSQILATRRRVVMTNLAVSGATMADVRADQLAAAVRRAPDLVLVAAGSNDVTQLRSGGAVRDDLVRVIDRLRAARCDVAIVVTGAADVGAVPRMAQPLRALAGLRTRQINAAVAEAARQRDVVFAPIAERTGPLFRDDRSLFAVDGFHPSAAGYATWVPILDEALGRALEQARRASC